MSADVKKNILNIKRGSNKEYKTFIIKHGNEEMEVKEDEAEFLCRTLCLYMGLSIVDQRENISMLTLKANENSTKENPLGFEHS